MISRDEENGNSTFIKPAESKRVDIFLKNQLGLDELFVKNLLQY
jgi:hypothetical protein